MKFATFNTNSVRARLPIIEGWLAREKPDVLCVQETKVQDQQGLFMMPGMRWFSKVRNPITVSQ